MALEGSLRDFDLFSLFNMIKIQGKNGTLVLSQGQEFVKVFFENGEIIGCDSNQVRMEDRVGTMLVRLGRLSGDELLQMIQLQRQTLKRMGTLLLESGKVSPSDLSDALFSQATSILHRTFRWVSGDYRFDSLLPQDLDREHFPPIPVDTVLMEAARIQDEWPEVEKQLPTFSTPLGKTIKGKSLHLDIHRDLSGVLEGQGGAHHGSDSGLSHDQEMVLSYFDQPQSIDDVIQISRFDELDTCKAIVVLLQDGLLEIQNVGAPKIVRPWVVDAPESALQKEWEGSSPLFWPMLAALIALPLFLYVPHHRGSYNVGLASLQPADLLRPPDGLTRLRQAWALRMASPKDGGDALARSLGRPLEGSNPIPDLSKQSDPLAPPPPSTETDPKDPKHLKKK
jgi:Domain of unknown function (DUF4388)